MWSQPRRLYVAEFRNGVVKVGITSAQPKSRLKSLAQHQGSQPVRSHFGAIHECGFWAEYELVTRLRRIATTHKGREWFTGVRFNAAKLLMEQVTRMAHALQAREQEAA